MARKPTTPLRAHGLTLALLGLFLLSLAGHARFGWLDQIEEQREHGGAAPGFVEYLGSGAFLESVGENWESEFLQMLAFVYLGCYLVQRGSPESRQLGKQAASDEDPRRHRSDRQAPWPVRRGGLVLLVYEHSLALAFFLLFAASFTLHVFGGWRAFNAEQALHAAPPVSLSAYFGSARFWFESFQNWQSEFLAVAALVYLTVYLRQRHSPQSKAVAAAHRESEA